jgi:hypothetical protein
MEPADPFTIQGRPYIDDPNKGDFVVITGADEDDYHGGRPADDNPADVAKVLALVEGDPSIGKQAIRRRTGFGISRVERILEADGWSKETGVWVKTQLIGETY